MARFPSRSWHELFSPGCWAKQGREDYIQNDTRLSEVSSRRVRRAADQINLDISRAREVGHLVLAYTTRTISVANSESWWLAKKKGPPPLETKTARFPVPLRDLPTLLYGRGEVRGATVTPLLHPALTGCRARHLGTQRAGELWNGEPARPSIPSCGLAILASMPLMCGGRIQTRKQKATLYPR